MNIQTNSGLISWKLLLLIILLLLIPGSHSYSQSGWTYVHSDTKSDFYWNSRAFGSVVYANGGLSVGTYKFFLNTPQTLTILQNQVGQPYLYAGSWTPSGWYAGCNSNELYKIDTSTGVRTLIGIMPSLGYTSGMAWDPTTNTLFSVTYAGIGSNLTRLYIVNLSNANTTLVGQSNSFLCCLACDNTGILYSIDKAVDKFGTVNKSTAAFTEIGSIGINIGIGDLECDHFTDSLFLTAFDSSMNVGKLMRVNKTTGASTIIDNFQGGSTLTGFAIPYPYPPTKIINDKMPVNYLLFQNYPNPFNPATTIEFQIPKRNNVRIIVLDMLGREVAVLLNEKLNAGTYEVEWNASNCPSGVYFYKLISGDFTETKKMVLVK